VFTSDEWGAHKCKCNSKKFGDAKMFDDGHVHPKSVDIFIPRKGLSSHNAFSIPWLINSFPCHQNT
jgi:hypothetical protein